MKIAKYAYPFGVTSRITVSLVNDTTHPSLPVADAPDRLVEYWDEVIATQPDFEADKESVIVVLLSTVFRAYAWNRVSLGTVNECTAHPREILRPVICGGAHAFALMHNHPSGSANPSRADEMVTRRLVEASNLMQIRLMDHIIIPGAARRPGDPTYFSFRECGLIP